MNRQHDKQRSRCLNAIDQAGRYLRLNSYQCVDTVVALICARNEINRTIVFLQPQRRRSRATVALFAAVGAVVFIAAPIGLRLLTQDRPAHQQNQPR